MSFQFTPYALPAIIGGIISALLAWTMWRRREGSGVIPFVVLTAGGALWSFFSALELSLADLPSKTLASNLTYIGITATCAAWFAFTVQYTGRGRWLTRRLLALMTIEPILVMIAAFTNDSHRLFRESWVLNTTGPLPTMEVVLGPLFWAHAVYSYALLLIGIVLLIHAFIRSPELYRGQVIFLLIAAFTPWVANAIFLGGFSPLPAGVDLTPIAFNITAISLAWGIYRYRLLDIIPVARDTVIENLTDPVFVIDPQGRLVDMNPAAASLLNIAASQAIGEPALSVFAPHASLVERLSAAEEIRAEVTIDTGSENRTLTLHMTPVRNRRGELTAKVCVLYDITSLKRASQALMESEERNRSLLEATFEAIVIHDQGTIIDVNRAFETIFGYTRDEMIGKSALTLATDETRPTVISNMQSGSEAPYEASGVRKDGTVFDGELRAKAATYRGQVVRVAAIRDITDRKQAERAIREQNDQLIIANKELAIARAQAEEATRLKSEFLSTMSHELRTPLNALVGYSQLLLAGISGELQPKQKDNVERMFANAKTLLNMINDILDLSRIEARRLEIVNKPFNLMGWAGDIMQETEGLAAAKDLRYTLEIDEKLPQIMLGDAPRLKQIALNLISNAIKFTDEGFVRIEIKKASDETWAFITHDSGVGIASHALEYIFEEFRQIDGSMQRRHGGTGLGLAIVRNLALLMNGDVKVSSKVEEGSTFTVTLPLLVTEPALETTSQ
jgi:PAS domain S-box-containing protein